MTWASTRGMCHFLGLQNLGGQQHRTKAGMGLLPFENWTVLPGVTTNYYTLQYYLYTNVNHVHLPNGRDRCGKAASPGQAALRSFCRKTDRKGLPPSAILGPDAQEISQLKMMPSKASRSRQISYDDAPLRGRGGSDL